MSERRFRIVVTQGEGASGSLAERFAALGAEVIAVPTISVEPPGDWEPLDRALASLDRFDWIVFTSRSAVEATLGRPVWQSARQRPLPGLRVAAVGKATARELREAGVAVDLVPDEAGGADLGRLMVAMGRTGTDFGVGKNHDDGAETASTQRPARDLPEAGPDRARPLAGIRVLWPRSEIASADLPDTLRAAGAEVVDPIAYRTVLPQGAGPGSLLTALDEEGIDAVTFMSPSSARNLSTLLGWSDLRPLAGRTTIASIGPTTSLALRELGAVPSVESAERTAEDLAETVIRFLRSPERTTT